MGRDRVFRPFFVAIVLRLRYKEYGPRSVVKTVRSPDHKSPSDERRSMAVKQRKRSTARNKAYRRVLAFPQARGKTVERVELDVTPEYFLIDIRFEDKTALTFDLEPYVMVYPEFANWGTGEYKPLKRWRPVHSRSSRIF